VVVGIAAERGKAALVERMMMVCASSALWSLQFIGSTITLYLLFL
jgi:hypothetical protein